MTSGSPGFLDLGTHASNSVAVQCALALALTISVAACGDDSAGNKANGGGGGYEATTGDLERWGSDLFAAIAAADDDRATALAQGLELRDPDAWFGEHFGDERGAELAKGYGPTARELGQLVDFFTDLASNGQTHIVVERFDERGDAAAVGYQSIALETMKNKTPLYSMRIGKVGADDVFHLWSFVYDDGFRWIGKLKSLSGEEPAVPDLLEYRIRDAERAAKAHADKSDESDDGDSDESD